MYIRVSAILSENEFGIQANYYLLVHISRQLLDCFLSTSRQARNGIVIRFVLSISCSPPGWRQSPASLLHVEIKMRLVISIILFYMLTPAKATTTMATTTTPSGRDIVKFRVLPTTLWDAGLDLPILFYSLNQQYQNEALC